MYLFKNTKNKLTRLSLNLIVYSFILLPVFLLTGTAFADSETVDRLFVLFLLPSYAILGGVVLLVISGVMNIISFFRIGKKSSSAEITVNPAEKKTVTQPSEEIPDVCDNEKLLEILLKEKSAEAATETTDKTDDEELILLGRVGEWFFSKYYFDKKNKIFIEKKYHEEYLDTGTVYEGSAEVSYEKIYAVFSREGNQKALDTLKKCTNEQKGEKQS